MAGFYPHVTKGAFFLAIRRALYNARLILHEVRESPIYFLLAIPFISYGGFIYSEILTRNLSFQFLGVFSLLIFSLRKLKPHTIQLRIKYIDLVIIAWSIIFLVKGYNSSDLPFAMSGLLIVWTISKSHSSNRIPFSFILAMYCLIAVGIIELISGSPIPLKGNLHNSGVYANCISIALPIILYTCANLCHKHLYVLGCIVFLTVVILTNSRIAIVGGLMGSAFYVRHKSLIFKNAFCKIKERFGSWFKSIILVVTITLIAGTIVYYKLDSSTGRLLIYSIAVQMILAHPINGMGLGSFKRNYLDFQAEYFTQHPGSKMSAYADNTAVAFNEYLQVWLELGFPGLILTIVTTIFLLTIKSNENNEKLVNSLKASCVIIFSLSLFSYPFQDINSAIYSLFCMGILSSFDNRTIYITKNLQLTKLLLPLVVLEILILFYLVNSGSKIVKAYKKWNHTLESQLEIPDSTLVYEYKLIYSKLKEDGLFLFNYASILSENGLYSESNNILKETQFYFNDVNIWTIKGDNYLGLRQYKEAEHSYLYAYRMIPNRFYPLNKLSELYKASNEPEKVRAIAKIIIEKKVKVPSSYIDRLKVQAINDLNYTSKSSLARTTM